MSDARIEGYARALFEIARADGTLDEVEDELFRFARSYESSDELRLALTDERTPVEKRQAIVEDLLDGKATSTTVQLVSMVVGSGRGSDLPAIVDSLCSGRRRPSSSTSPKSAPQSPSPTTSRPASRRHSKTPPASASTSKPSSIPPWSAASSPPSATPSSTTPSAPASTS